MAEVLGALIAIITAEFLEREGGRGVGENRDHKSCMV